MNTIDTLTQILTTSFERFPEWPIKNDIRNFLAFSPFIPSFIQDLSPLKGYELYRKLKKGDVVIDAGAFTGDYTIFAAKKVGSTGKIIAFEPDEKNRKILERNILHENLNNVIIIPKGLWNKNTILNFRSFDGLHSNLTTTINQGDQGNQGNVSIAVVKLDDELKKIGVKKIDVIKMDIEGAEIEAIQGCIKTLKKYNPFVIIASYHIVNGKETCIFLESFLKSKKLGLGFNVKSDFPKHLTTYAWKLGRTNFF